MLVIRKIVKINELESYLRDTSYSKIEVKPATLKKMRDIAILCYYKVHPSSIQTHMHSLLDASRNKELPSNIKEKIGGFYGNFGNNNLWMTLADFKEMIDIETEYKLQFSIPKSFKKLYQKIALTQH